MISANELSELYFTNYGMSHLYSVKLLFSLKNKKFVKPFSISSRHFDYRVLPGQYLIIETNGNRDVEIVTWKVQLVKVNAGLNQIEVIKEVKWETPLAISQRSVPILKDIKIPNFREFTGVYFSKVYSDDEINKLMEGGIDPGLMGEME